MPQGAAHQLVELRILIQAPPLVGRWLRAGVGGERLPGACGGQMDGRDRVFGHRRAARQQQGGTGQREQGAWRVGSGYGHRGSSF
ncbi:hypothetical protein CLJ1_1896 [Pseudomonas paraeruginosa]|nr:hypothetical protein CLJ1_1896 [Pseudomonas aeruginosa]